MAADNPRGGWRSKPCLNASGNGVAAYSGRAASRREGPIAAIKKVERGESAADAGLLAEI